MSFLSEEVQVLNAEGIDLLDQGRLTEAADAFSHSISQLSWCVLIPTPVCWKTAEANQTPANPNRIQNDTGVSENYEMDLSDEDDNIMDGEESDEDKDEEVGVYCPREQLVDARWDDFFTQAFYFECFFPAANKGNACCNKYKEQPRFAEPMPSNIGQQEQGPGSTTTTTTRNGGSNAMCLTTKQHLTATVCCLFNLALCYHLTWQQQQNRKQQDEQQQRFHNKLVMEQDPRLLQAALRQYEEAFTLIRSTFCCILGGRTSRRASSSRDDDERSNPNQNNSILSSPQDPLCKVFMAVCTNGAHCHRELGNFQEALRWNHVLCQILSLALPREQPQAPSTRGTGEARRPQNHDGDDEARRGATAIDEEDEDATSFFPMTAMLNRVLIPPTGPGVARAA